MKTFMLLFFYSLCLTLAMGQSKVSSGDSLNYELQRVKVNKLLDQRSQKFGDFTASIDKKTGVFGIFKTKKDQQKSIDILKAVVITDNQIFLETKRLLDIKDVEREKYKNLASEYDNQVTHYMKTISKLQQENEKLHTQIASLETEDHSSSLYIYFGVFSILMLIVIIFILYKKLQQQKVTLL